MVTLGFDPSKFGAADSGDLFTVNDAATGTDWEWVDVNNDGVANKDDGVLLKRNSGNNGSVYINDDVDGVSISLAATLTKAGFTGAVSNVYVDIDKASATAINIDRDIATLVVDNDASGTVALAKNTINISGQTDALALVMDCDATLTDANRAASGAVSGLDTTITTDGPTTINLSGSSEIKATIATTGATAVTGLNIQNIVKIESKNGALTVASAGPTGTAFNQNISYNIGSAKAGTDTTLDWSVLKTKLDTGGVNWGDMNNSNSLALSVGQTRKGKEIKALATSGYHEQGGVTVTYADNTTEFIGITANKTVTTDPKYLAIAIFDPASKQLKVIGAQVATFTNFGSTESTGAASPSIEDPTNSFIVLGPSGAAGPVATGLNATQRKIGTLCSNVAGASGISLLARNELSGVFGTKVQNLQMTVSGALGAGGISIDANSGNWINGANLTNTTNAKIIENGNALTGSLGGLAGRSGASGSGADLQENHGLGAFKAINSASFTGSTRTSSNISEAQWHEVLLLLKQAAADMSKDQFKLFLKARKPEYSDETLNSLFAVYDLDNDAKVEMSELNN